MIYCRNWSTSKYRLMLFCWSFLCYWSAIAKMCEKLFVSDGWLFFVSSIRFGSLRWLRQLRHCKVNATSLGLISSVEGVSFSLLALRRSSCLHGFQTQLKRLFQLESGESLGVIGKSTKTLALPRTPLFLNCQSAVLSSLNLSCLDSHLHSRQLYELNSVSSCSNWHPRDTECVRIWDGWCVGTVCLWVYYHCGVDAMIIYMD